LSQNQNSKNNKNQNNQRQMKSQFQESGESREESLSLQKKSADSESLRTTGFIAKRMRSVPVNGPANGEQISHLNNGRPLQSDTENGARKTEPQKSKKLLDIHSAARLLGCHWQTLLYRERKGQLSSLKINRKKYYYKDELEKLKETRPIATRPHWTRSYRMAAKTEKLHHVDYVKELAEYAKPYRPRPKTFWQKLKSIFGF